MSTKKFVSAALAATTTVWLSGAMLLVPTASAQSTDALQAQIASLLAQIAALQGQLNGGSTGSTTGAYTFAKDLTLGAKGADVNALQNVLIAGGFLKIAAPTGYFGAMTKAAVVAYQTAKGISPASGYVGPKTRAVLNASATPGTGTGTTLPGSGLAVSLAADSATGSAISGAGQVKVGKFNFTAAANGGVTVTGLEFTKVGVLSDSSISNLYLADAATGEVVAQYQSLTGGVATFSGLALNVAAGQTWVGELRMDLASGVSAGNTIAWKLSKVVTASNATVTGAPQSNALTVTSVSNPAIATVALSETIPNGTDVSVDAGTAGALVSSWTANVGNSAVNLTNMQFQFVGSANPADVKNLVLKVNGTQVATLPMAAATTNFNFVSAPVRLPTGNSVIELYADVLGSPNRSFRMSLLQPYRVGVIDTQYNTGVSPTVTNGTKSVLINTGSATLSLATDSPTGNLPNAASNQTLAKFRMYAAGEPIKVKYLSATITAAGGTSWTAIGDAAADLRNVKLIDDAGGQIGNTISTMGGTTNSNDCSITGQVLTCRFGTASSPVNYIVPANTSRVLSLVVDITSDNDRTSFRGAMVAGSGNLEGQISYQAASSGAAQGANRIISTTPLSVVANSGFSAPSYAAGASGVKIASFVISAASAEGAKISSLTFDKDSNANIDLQNLKVMVGTTQFGATRATVADAEASLTFSASTPVNVAAGGSVTVDVYSDILTTSAAGSQAAVIDLIGWLALGATSNSSITFPGAVNGQSVTIASGPALTVARAGTSAPVKQVVMGSTGNSLFTIRLTADNVEDIRVTEVSLQDNIVGGAANAGSFQNVALYDGTTLVSGPKSMTMNGSATTSIVTFTISGDGLIVPKGGTAKNLELKADVADYTSGGAVSGSTHTFSLLNSATSSIVAVGRDSGVSAVVSGLPVSNTSTVYRTKVTLSSALLGASTGRTRSTNDDLATLTFAANSSGAATINTITLKFQGGALNTTSTFQVSLMDTASGETVLAGPATCSPSSSSCSVTFNPTSFVVDANTQYVTRVRVNSSAFANGSQGDSVSVTVNSASDVTFNDGVLSNVPLESAFTVGTVTFE